MRLFVEKLTSIDSSFLCPQRGIVGESWLLDVELGGALNEQQMVFDFADVKRTIKRYVDDHFDHKLLLPGSFSGIERLPAAAGMVCLSMSTERGQVWMSAPEQAVTWLDAAEVSCDSLAIAITDGLRPMLPANVTDVHISLRHEDVGPPHFHYSHGLRMHGGNCQRIAHGHRSRLRIAVDGQYDEGLTRLWCQRWQPIYLAHVVDRISWAETPFAARGDGRGLYCFGYRAGQGEFVLALPEQWCELVTVDTTIEQIAGYIATTVAARLPGKRIDVRVYEGVEKGAVAMAGGTGSQCGQ